MNKKILGLGLGLGVIAIVGLIVVASNIGLAFAGSQNVTGIAARTSVASSTLQYLSSASASSTLEANIPSGESVSILVCNTASSSSAVLNLQLRFSAQSPFEIPTWYQETAESISGGTATHSSLTRTLSLATTTLGTNYKCDNIFVNPVGANRIQVKYGVTASNTGIYMEIAPKSNF